MTKQKKPVPEKERVHRGTTLIEDEKIIFRL
jgi:hypothetical protein